MDRVSAKKNIMPYIKDHPGCRSEEVAFNLGVSDWYVRQVARRAGFIFPSCRTLSRGRYAGEKHEKTLSRIESLIFKDPLLTASDIWRELGIHHETAERALRELGYRRGWIKVKKEGMTDECE
jgi:hypothetical protein